MLSEKQIYSQSSYMVPINSISASTQFYDFAPLSLFTSPEVEKTTLACSLTYIFEAPVGYPAQRKNSVTLSQYIHFYFSTWTKAETTYIMYFSMFERIADHYLCSMYLEDIRPMHLKDLMIHLQRTTSLTNNSINKYLQFVSSVLSDAWRNEYVKENVALKVLPLARNPIKEPQFYTIEECKTIFQKLNEGINDNLNLALQFGIKCGLRRGEICGLKWENVNLEQQYVNIVETRTTMQSRIIVKSPKTYGSYRKVFMDNKLFEFLKKVYMSRKQNGYPMVYILETKTGKPIHPMSLSNHYKKFCIRTGIRKLRFHDTRHTFASLAYQNDIPLLKTSKVMGHSTTKTTERVYTHLEDDHGESVIRKIAGLFE